MSEGIVGPNGEKPGDNGKMQPEQPQQPPELHIIWNEQGIGVKGIVKNEMAALYMLEKAKDLIKRINAPQISTAKIVPKGGILNFARRKR